jgi:putative ubiquitin-RnfH superfamily antitoxin RatB of RatAB toxin-antitoxin module
VGIFGKITRLDTKLEEGNRVEIYRPITANPETVERRDNRLLIQACPAEVDANMHAPHVRPCLTR